MIKRAKHPEKSPKKDSKNTLATTIVELCRSEETGVGPSMAFGSHELKKVIDDFAKTAKNTKKEFSKTKKQNNKKSLIRFSNMAKNALF